MAVVTVNDELDYGAEQSTWEYIADDESVARADKEFRKYCTRYGKRYNIPSSYTSGVFSKDGVFYTVLKNGNGVIAAYKQVGDSIHLDKKPDPTLVYEVTSWF